MAKLIVSSSVLLNRIEPLKGLVATKPILPILGCFLFELEASVLKVSASDLSVYLSTEVPVDATAVDPFSCCVPARLLTDLLARLFEQPLTLLFNPEMSTMAVLSHSGTFELPLQDATDWPQSTEATPGTTFTMPVEELSHALGHTAFATSVDELRPAMTCVYIESHLGLRFIATNGHCIVRVERPNAGVDECSALLPGKAAGLLLKLLAEAHGLASLEITPTTIICWLSSYHLIARQMEGEFPKTDRFFVAKNPYVLTCGKSALIGALKTVLLFTNRITGLVRLDLRRPDYLVLSAEDESWQYRAKEVLEGVEFEGDKLAIGFPGKLLMELLEHVDGPLIDVSFLGPLHGAIVREISVESEEVTVTSIIMPMMLGDYPEDMDSADAVRPAYTEPVHA